MHTTLRPTLINLSTDSERLVVDRFLAFCTTGYFRHACIALGGSVGLHSTVILLMLDGLADNEMATVPGRGNE